MIPKKQVKELKNVLTSVKRPLFYYDSDPDGLCSFLLFYRFVKEGKGVLVKSASHLDKRWKQQVDKYNPDSVFVLDMPGVCDVSVMQHS